MSALLKDLLAALAALERVIDLSAALVAEPCGFAIGQRVAVTPALALQVHN